MTKHEVDTDSPAPPESGAKPTTSTPDFGDRALAEAGQNLPVDVTEYKTDELKERFQQLFGVPWDCGWSCFCPEPRWRSAS